MLSDYPNEPPCTKCGGRLDLMQRQHAPALAITMAILALIGGALLLVSNAVVEPLFWIGFALTACGAIWSTITRQRPWMVCIDCGMPRRELDGWPSAVKVAKTRRDKAKSEAA